MAWQRPSCIVQAVQSARQAARLQSSFRSSASPLSPITSQFLFRSQKNVRGFATEMQPDSSLEASRTPLEFSPEALEPPTETQEGSTAPAPPAAPAAPPIDFSQFATRPARIVPASPAYFSGSPKFIDHLLHLERLLAHNAALPTLEQHEAPRSAWLKLSQFRDMVGETVPSKKYRGFLRVLQRLGQIDPKVLPEYVSNALQAYVRPGNPYSSKPEPPTIDSMGRARGRGKRKASSAVVYLVEGEGEVLVNGKSLLEVFPRVHDRESALWPLRCTKRLDKYNVWASVRGGGTTGQAEAITLAVARALLIHEPALKPTMRSGRSSLTLATIILANLQSHSWRNYGRCASGGEKEARPSQGAQDAHLGQAVKADVCTKHVCLSCLCLISLPSCIIPLGHCGFQRKYILYSKSVPDFYRDCLVSCKQCNYGVGFVLWASRLFISFHLFTQVLTGLSVICKPTRFISSAIPHNR